MSTHNIPFSIYKRKSTLIIQNLQRWDFFQGTQERVQNTPGKRAITVRATEGLLYYQIQLVLKCLTVVGPFILSKTSNWPHQFLDPLSQGLRGSL